MSRSARSATRSVKGKRQLKKNGASKSSKHAIIVRGARQHNLRGVDLDIPRNKLVVFSGPSGSGKSSLAFDTIYAEGQRRYVESLSAYARQFLERMDKPDVDYISGLSPAIAIEQKTVSKNPRSNVATQTEIYDHLRLLYARVGKTVSPVSGEIVTKDSPRSVAESLQQQLEDGSRFYLCFPFPDRKKIPVQEELKMLLARGFYRILVQPTRNQREKGAQEELIDLNETPPEKVRVARKRLSVLVDRLAIRHDSETTVSRIADSVEMAFREGGGRVLVFPVGGHPLEFSEFFERDGMRFIEPIPNLFSFNSPYGACPTCQGFGRVQGIDPDLVIPDGALSIRQGAVAPFRTDRWTKHFSALIKAASENRIDIDKPYQALPEEHKELVWEGAGEYIGVNGFVRYLERRSYKMHYRILLSRYRGYSTCYDCSGFRLRPDALYVQVGGLNIGQVCELTTADALAFIEALELSEFDLAIAGRVVSEINKRLKYLVEVGLDYLSLDRLSHSLSGGESQRINLSTSLGSSLVGSLYVLDEPSIGLHPRDTGRLIRILKNLRDIGNTVVVVEHEEALMRQSDYVVDIGPGSGIHGGEVVFQGPPEQLLVSESSLTGKYLSGRAAIEIPERRRIIDPQFAVTVQNAHEHNLKRLDVSFPLGAFVVVTGVSGSGKSTLVHDTLWGGLARLRGMNAKGQRVGAHTSIRGAAFVDEIEMVDQTPIGRSPRSNPITYLKAFNSIRDLLANTHHAKLQGLRPGFFSFNVPGGRCEVCSGEGSVTVEMQFLADLYLECEACKGRRYKQEALDIRYKGKNVHDILQMTVDEAVAFFEDVTPIVSRLSVLRDIGLGYITLGQPSNTLSGGEAQRVKLAAHLGKQNKDHTLYIFDEPTTGLHFDDIKKLLAALNRLVDAGHSVIVVEHNLDVIKSADWLIDLGPEGGRRGGFLVAEGTPEDVATVESSHTGRFLRDLL
ncbi:MAG: excinuclease ABC subunit UvrA [Rhodothermales bacterium]|nr:excinuclease ABC subunit UvrA [Rhodothermales bacterium]